MKDSNLRFPRSKQGGIAASPMRDKMAYREGFEPPLAVLETVVLPLTLAVYKLWHPARVSIPFLYLERVLI